MTWQPKFGAWVEGEGTRFRIWAPRAQKLEVVIYSSGGPKTFHALENSGDGFFTGWVPKVTAGARYKFRPDEGMEFPDPASRYQPEGVHGASEVVDSSHFVWHDSDWKGKPLEDLVIYEIHVGTFTPEGTFAAVISKLPLLVELGVTAIELMPLADFPGQRNWGYDGVDLFAPARCYGQPEDLRQLVDEAHRLGLVVILDVVYNHLGPDGNYMGVYTQYWESTRHQLDWGAAINFDGPHSDKVREFLCNNAIYWLDQFHFDGLRLDATHVMYDDSHQHILAELNGRVKQAIPNRQVLVIAEDLSNLAKIITPVEYRGWGLDGVWSDDFHHQLRRFLAGDHEAYYQDYSGTTEDLATTIRLGWFYIGQHSAYQGRPRGTDPFRIRPAAFVICIQNHDQTGNRALGERLSHQIGLAEFRAATALLLCCPQTPLLFMGQEWAASSPFQFFTDHNEELGRLVTEGRRAEFRHFSAFTDPRNREKIPDPQAEATFLRSKLKWEERTQSPHAENWNLYQALLHLRKTEPVMRSTKREDYACFAPSDAAIVLQRRNADATLLVVCQLRGTGTVDLNHHSGQITFAGKPWELVFSTEESRFATDSQPPQIDLSGTLPKVHFARPGAVLLRQ